MNNFTRVAPRPVAFAAVRRVAPPPVITAVVAAPTKAAIVVARPQLQLPVSEMAFTPKVIAEASRVTSPVIAPAIIMQPTERTFERRIMPAIAPPPPQPAQSAGIPQVPIEKAKPALTAPAGNPYAADASWEPFTETKGLVGASPSPFEDEPTGKDPFDDADDFVPQDSKNATIKGTPVVATSWFDKFLSAIGLSRKKVVSATMAGEAASMASLTQTEAAAQLVRRARNGDQNAMAMIVCVREAAARGNAKAIMSAKFMHAYITSHPVGDPSEFGIDDVIPRKTPLPSDPATAAAVALSHGPTLSNPRIGEFVRLACFGEEEIGAFKHGMAGRPMRNPNPRIQQANRAGALIAHARKLQAVRMPHTSVSKFDATIGWELGEDIE